MGKGDFDGALQDLDNALQLDPDFTYALSMRGMAYLQKGDLDRAIQDFEDALERGLNSSNTYNNKGVAYEMKGDLARAMQDYDQALRIKPNRSLWESWRCPAPPVGVGPGQVGLAQGQQYG